MIKKNLIYSLLMICAIIFTSCAKDMGALDPSYFKTTPNPLEVKGSKVEATVAGKFPVKYFN
ncbi:MAG: hypothetical protein LBB41_05600, partial [Prevotellaceae bacterium]|nr:hypothetical protein [Prevotellaceae bacterium]